MTSKFKTPQYRPAHFAHLWWPASAKVKGSRESIFIAFIFGVGLAFFCLFTVANFFSRTNLLEDNRLAARCPSRVRQFATFAGDFEKCFNDRFAFREKLIACGKLGRIKLFKVPASQDVLLGKADFFFCAAKGGHLGLLQGTPPFTSQELVGWKNLLEKRAIWCRKRGIDYLFALAPNKSSIYPELLPSHYRTKGGPTRTDQLINFLQESHSCAQAIDLRKSVRAGKGSLPLYLRTDTHWNQLGAYYGYCSIIENVRLRYPSIPPPRLLSQFKIVPYDFKKGDLARLQGLLGVLTEESVAVHRPTGPPWTTVRYPKWLDNKYGMDDTTPFYCELKGSKLPRALMFRDSFASPLAELFLPEHFSRSAFYWQPEFSEDIVLREKPDIVIHEALETCLYEDLPAT